MAKSIYNDNERTIPYTGTKDTTLENVVIEIFRISKEDLDKLNISVTDVFNYGDNTTRILAEYTPSEKNQYPNGSQDLIKAGTTLLFPTEFSTEAHEVEITNFVGNIKLESYTVLKSFIGQTNDELINNEKFKPSRLIKDKNLKQTLLKQQLNISVFIYSRTLDELINVTPFVMSCQSNVADGGGNFSLMLPPITAEYNEEDDGEFSTTDSTLKSINELTSIKTFTHRGQTNYIFKNFVNSVITAASKSATVSSGRQSNSNDSPTEYSGDFTTGEVPKERQIFNPKLDQGEDNQIERTKNYWVNAISAQDMVFIKYEALEIEVDNDKRIIDPFKDILTMGDINGDVFDMIGLVDNVSEMYSPSNADVSISVSGRDLSKLILEDGSYVYPVAPQQESFQGMFFGNADEAKKGGSFRRMLGEIQDINLFVEKPISYPINFIFKMMGNIEVFRDSVFSQIDDDTSSNADAIQVGQSAIPSTADNKFSFETDTIPNDPRTGIWKLVNLIIDDGISETTLLDSSLASNSGSIMNYLSRICQKPFVEFFTDTYGDRFYWIVRRPPWTQEAFLDNFTIDIEEESVLNTNLTMSDDKAFSWYRLIPIASYFGDDLLAKFEFPAQFFHQYAAIYGSRPFEQNSNYIQFKQNVKSERNALFANAIAQLRHLVEVNAHMPFTRQGSMTITGDRRIKKGMNVYLKSTGELFYVESVSQNYNVNQGTTDRVTTIMVSRGIVLKHAEKYFNIIRFNEPTPDDLAEQKVAYKVNEGIFNFLLNKNQFK